MTNLKNIVRTTGSTARIIADAVLILAALAVAFLLRSVLFYSGDMNWGMEFGLSALIIIPICLITFSLSGFYSKGRSYQSKYKALIVFQAVSVAFLIFGAFAFLVKSKFLFASSVIPIGWFFTLLFVGGARLWSVIWKKIIVTEESGKKRKPSEIKSLDRVLVIGGAGYIGSGLIPVLLESGLKVRVLDLLIFGTDPLKKVLSHPNLEIVQADFRQVEQVVQAMKGVDAVIHLGAIVGDPACALDEELTKDINLMATKMIAEVAKGYGVQRFIFASTCSVYGAGDEILDEHSALNPVSLYAKTKIGSESILMEMSGPDFNPIILRFGTIYGLSGRTRFDLVINLLTAKALVESKITVFGGDQWRPFVHVMDAGKAVLAALTAPLSSVKGEIFNVGSNPQNKTIADIAQMIADIVPGSEIVNMGSDGDKRNYRVDFKKINSVLKYQTDWTIEKGIEQVRDAIKSGKVDDYKDSKYSNVRSLSDDLSSEQPVIRIPNSDFEELLLVTEHN